MVLDALFAAEVAPFFFAGGVLALVAMIEGLALVIGASATHWLDGAMADLDPSEGLVSSALDWLHIGKVPILAIIVIFLVAFSATGFVVQFATRSAIGSFMPMPAATGVALLAAIYAVRVLGATLGRIVPKDETSAVPDASLVGRVGTIVIGAATAGKPAEARLRDEHGGTHYVMVEPEETDESFETGASVLLVRHLSGRRFHAIRNPKPELL
jgi:hypothetical protein